MAEIKGLSARDRPPETIRQAFKKYHKFQVSDVENDPDIIDLEQLDFDNLPESIKLSGSLSSKELRLAFDEFVKGGEAISLEQSSGGLIEDIPVFAHQLVSGLQMIPSLFPSTVQTALLSRIFHRDLSDPRHRTNIHLHYDIPYPEPPDCQTPGPNNASLFQTDPTTHLPPKDPATHKPITVQNLLEKKLRWITLGGQYNWTTKEYPEGPPPSFPQDIARLLRVAFPDTKAQAAIVNLYSAGDTLSVHRDVSEECDSGLISVSFGCDGLFLVSHDDGVGCEVIRLRSGDTVYMAGRSRFAWHGVPKVLASTCPQWLEDWPGEEYGIWRGWMDGKRVNLNVRQMSAVDQPIALEH